MCRYRLHGFILSEANFDVKINFPKKSSLYTAILLVQLVFVPLLLIFIQFGALRVNESVF